MFTITCPSGLSFHARKWLLGDLGQILESAEDRENTNLLIAMADMAALPDGVIDPGPYAQFQSGGKIDWLRVTNVDLISALIQIRRKTRNLYSFNPACQHCGKLQPEGIEIDLNEIPIYSASSEGTAAIQNGMPAALPPIDVGEGQGQILVKLRPILGSDIPRMAILQRQDPGRAMEIAACYGIEQIIQLPPTDPETMSSRSSSAPGTAPGTAPITGLQAIREFYRQQDWDFGSAIEEGIDNLFGGPDTVYEFRCANVDCSKEQEGALPLDLRFFGVEARKKKKQQRKRSLVGG